MRKRDFSCGPSQLVPGPRSPAEAKDPEATRQRHAARLQCARQHRETLREWCRYRGLDAFVSSDENYWRFRRGYQVARWTPTTGYLVLIPDVRHRDGRQHGKAHDWLQVTAALEKFFFPKPPTSQSPIV